MCRGVRRRRSTNSSLLCPSPSVYPLFLRHGFLSSPIFRLSISSILNRAVVTRYFTCGLGSLFREHWIKLIQVMSVFATFAIWQRIHGWSLRGIAIVGFRVMSESKNPHPFVPANFLLSLTVASIPFVTPLKYPRPEGSVVSCLERLIKDSGQFLDDERERERERERAHDCLFRKTPFTKYASTRSFRYKRYGIQSLHCRR